MGAKVRKLATVVLLLICNGCGALSRHDSDSVLNILSSNENFYRQFAEQWLRENNPGMFCSFGDGDYRWDDTFFRKVDAGYEVRRGGATILNASNLEDAISSTGKEPAKVLGWIEKAKAGRVYCVQTKPTGAEGEESYVEIMLEGSGFDPYGLRYAPEGHEKAYESLMNFARYNGSPMDYKMKHLEGRWFYFSGKR